MNAGITQRRDSIRLASLIALALGFAAAGCSSDFYQKTKTALMNKTSNTASTTAANKYNRNAAPAAAPAQASVVVVPAQTPAMAVGAAPAAYYPGQMPVLPYKISTTDQAKAAGQSDACKNAKTGACSAFAGGSTNGMGQAACLASCTASVCGQSDMAQYYAQQAQANGMNCGQ